MNSLTITSLNQLEELAYALQIDYDPPMLEEDRMGIINEVRWLVQNMDKINEAEIIERRRQYREKCGIVCYQKESLSGVNLLLLDDSQLIFYPTDHNGQLKYDCFTRDEVKDYILKKGFNPYTMYTYKVKDLYIFQLLLDERPYPNIAVDSLTVEIAKRLHGKEFSLTMSIHNEMLNKFIDIVDDRLIGYDLDILKYFIDDLSVDDYNLFLCHKGLEKVIDARETLLPSLIDKYNSYINDGKSVKADRFITTIIFAIDEFVYMIRNGLNYQQLLEESGKIVIGEIKELYWKPNFLVEEYYPDGLLSTRYYIDESGKRNGVYISYHEDGSVKNTSNYFNGKLDGKHVKYYRDGIVKSTVNYIDGKADGECIKYYENGNKYIVYYMKMDKMEGYYVKYDRMGNIINLFDYSNGNKVGKQMAIGLHGIMSVYNIDKEGRYQAEYSEYLDGIPIRKTNYLNGIQVGLQEYFFINGKPKLSYTTNKMGLYNGKYTLFQENGLKILTYNYKDGVRVGMQKFYHTDKGNIRRRFILNENGKQDGIDEQYDKDGKLRRLDYYRNGKLIPKY